MANQVAVDVEVAWPYIQKRLEKYLAGATLASAGSAGGATVGEHALDGPLHSGSLARSQAPWVASDIASAITNHAALVDVHHARSHSIISSSDHTIVGAAFTLVGATAPDALGLITPSANPGTAEAVLKAVGGLLTLPNFTATTAVRTPLVDTASGNLTLQPAGNFVKLASGKGIETAGTFVSGFTGSGMRIDDGVTKPSKTSIEADNLTIRGTMRVYELIIQQIRMTNGSLLVSSAGKVKAVSGSGPYTVTTDGQHGFAVNDLILAQRWNPTQGALTGTYIYRSALRVTGITTVGTDWQFTATLLEGDAPIEGAEYGRIGNTTDTNRQGGVYLTSDDTYAPYIDIYNDVASMADWTGAAKLKVRLGRLDGISDAVLNPSGYGLYSANVFLKGVVSAANDVVRLDSTGVRVKATTTSTFASTNAYRLTNASGTEMGGLYGRDYTSGHSIGVQALGDATHSALAALTSTGANASGAATTFIEARNSAGTKVSSVTVDVTNSASYILFGAADYAQFNMQTRSIGGHRPLTDLGASLGEASYRWGTVYANQIIATTISGATMSGAEWEYAGNMVVDANSASANTTVSIVNQAAGAWVANLAVEGSITSGGVAVSLAGHTHDDRYFTESESDARYVQTATLSGYLLASGATVGATSQAQEFSNGAILVAPTVTASQLALRSARAAIASGNLIGGIDFQSNDTNLIAPGTVTASIQALTTAAHTASQLGTDIVFFASTGTTLLSEGLRVKQSGIAVPRMGLGTVSPAVARLINIAETYTTDATNYGIYEDVSFDGAITTTRTSYGMQLLARNARDATDIGGATNTLYGANVILYNNDLSVASTMYGSNAQVVNQGAGSITSAFGALNQVLNQGAGSITNVYAVSAEAENTGGATVTASTGVRGYLYNTNGTVTDAYGHYSWIRTNGASAIHTNSYTFYARQDRDAGTSSNAYLYYGVFEGTHTLKRGLWLSGETENAVSGKLAVGSLTAPTYTLDVAGTARATGVIYAGSDIEMTGELLAANGSASVPSVAALSDANTGLYWSAADTLAISAGGVQRAAFSSAGMTLPTGKFEATAIDQGHILDQALVGTIPGASGWAGFAHKDKATLTEFALLHTSAGDTVLNGKTTASVWINGSEVLSINSARGLPAGSGLKDWGDYNRRWRTIHAEELAVQTLVAQNVIATIGGDIIVTPTTKLISDVISTAGGIGQSALYTNLVAYWKLNEGSGDRYDSKGSNTLTSTNSVGMVATGIQENAAQFVKASSQRLSATDNSALSVGDIDFYISCWVYGTLDDGTSQYIAAKAGSSGNRAWYLLANWSSNQIQFRVFDSTDASATVTASTFGTITTGVWYFVEAWHSAASNQVGVAVNGVSNTTSWTTGARDDTGPFQIGAANSSSHFDGYVDEFGYWKNYIPNSTERTWLYNAGVGRTLEQMYVYGVTDINLDVEHNNLRSGEWILLKTAPAGLQQTEKMLITSSYTPVTVGGKSGYRYTASRDQDGTGPNNWYIGDAVASQQKNVGEGHLWLTATTTVHGHTGPALIGYVRTGALVNDIKPVFVKGNLRSFVDYVSDEYGDAAGNDLTLLPNTGFAGYTIDRTAGLRLFNANVALFSGFNKIIGLDTTRGLDIEIDTADGDSNRAISYRSSGVTYNWLKAYSTGGWQYLKMAAEPITGLNNAVILRTSAAASQESSIFLNTTNAAGNVVSNYVYLHHKTDGTGELELSSATVTVFGAVTLTGGVGTQLTVSGTSSFGGNVGITGGASISPSAGVVGVTVTTPANQSIAGLNLTAANCGSSYGPYINISHNNNGSTPAAGHITINNKNGTYYSVWPDGSGNLRIVGSAQPTNATDLGGTVVGAQTSYIGTKTDIAPWTDVIGALDAVLSTSLYHYRLRDNDDRRLYSGLIISDEDRGAWFSENDAPGQTPALNERNLFGYLIAAIKAQQVQIEELRRQLDKRERADAHTRNRE